MASESTMAGNNILYTCVWVVVAVYWIERHVKDWRLSNLKVKSTEPMWMLLLMFNHQSLTLHAYSIAEHNWLHAVWLSFWLALLFGYWFLIKRFLQSL